MKNQTFSTQGTFTHLLWIQPFCFQSFLLIWFTPGACSPLSSCWGWTAKGFNWLLEGCVLPSPDCLGLETSMQQKGQVWAQQEAPQSPWQDPLPGSSHPAVPRPVSAPGIGGNLHGAGLMELRIPCSPAQDFFPAPLHSTPLLNWNQGSAQRLRGEECILWAGQQGMLQWFKLHDWGGHSYGTGYLSRRCQESARVTGLKNKFGRTFWHVKPMGQELGTLGVFLLNAFFSHKGNSFWFSEYGWT